MATPVVASVSSTNSVNVGTTSLTIPAPSGTAEDDLLVAFVDNAGDDTITPPSVDWTEIEQASPLGHVKLGAFWRWAAASQGDSTFTFDGTSKNGGGILRITGADTTTPVLISDITTQLSPQTADHVAPSVNVTVDDCLMLCGFGANAAGGESYTAPGTMAQVFQEATGGASSAFLLVAEEDVASGNTGTRTATFTTNSRFAAATVVIQGPVASGDLAARWGWVG